MAKKKPKKHKKPQKRIPAKPKPKFKKEPMAKLLLPLYDAREVFRTRYGFFLYDGSEYVITAPDSPAPWANIITNDNYGFVVTQTGGGFSFKKSINDRITAWRGDINADKEGKFFYIRDNDTNEIWSASWNPVCKKPQFYEVRHGIGYTNITNKYADIISSLICFVAREEAVELWQMRIRNMLNQPRSISIFSYIEWDFNKNNPFLKASFNQESSAIFTHSINGEVRFHSVNKQVNSFTADRKAFLGIYRDTHSPRSVEKGMCFKEEGRYLEPAACLHIDLNLQANDEKELIFALGIAPDEKKAQEVVKKYKDIKEVEIEFSNMGRRWGEYLKRSMSIKTPDEGANILNNNWFRYQTISSGLSAKGCYYNPEGTIRFKDFLLNSLIFLPINPEVTKRNILECAKRQFQDGNVLTSWDPITDRSKISEYSDDPLWLIFSICEYIKETADLNILKEKTAYLDAQPDVLFNHCLKSIHRLLDLTPKKGLPPIMKGDANRKLDKIGTDGKGHSVWLAEFLCYTMDEFASVCKLARETDASSDIIKRSAQIKDNVNSLAQGCDWYPRAIMPKGALLGKHEKKDSRIFLNAQTWAVIARLIEGDNATKLMNTVAKYLYKSHGPIALSPSYDAQDSNIGTLTHLPPGVEENGGTNIEFACWAAWAETVLGRAYNAWDIYSRLNPVHRAHQADIYEMEPFVASGYIDGPDAAKFGQARYSWYGTSAFWLNKILTEHILGIKPTYQGLVIAPCIPKRWRLFKIYRAFRKARYIIDVVNFRHVCSGIAEMVVDGKKVKSNILPAYKDDKSHYVRVTMGKPHL